MIKLSFCIPTLNRALFISQTLESIIEQRSDEVEIVIVDGASTDNTEEIVRSFQQRSPRINYHRRDKNMGVERDTQKAIELARGEYCWLMTSDDVLKPGAVTKILEGIDEGHDLIVVNAEVRNLDLSQQISTSSLKFQEARIYKAADAEKLFVETADYLTYMGAVVIRKSLWDGRDKAAYLDTDFVHVGVIFQSPIPKTLVIGTPLIMIRYGNATWTPRAFEIIAFKWPRIVWSFRDFSEDAKRKVCLREGWRNLRTLIVYRATGAFSPREYDKWISALDGKWWDKAIAKAISLVPAGPLNLILLAYFRIRSHRPTVLINLRQSRYCWLKHPRVTI